MISRLAALRRNPPGIPVLLLGISVLAYGLLIPWLGFYWDDFPLLWIFNRFGGQGLQDYFFTNRPFWGWLYQVSMPLLGSQAWRWQVFALAWHYVDALAFWMLLRMVWPRLPKLALWASLLFLVYPGFLQQHISIIYSHLFIVQACFLFSLWASVKGAAGGRYRWLWQVLALVLSLYNLLAMEYFFFLELVRVALLWFAGQAEKPSLRLKQTLRAWLPYLALWAGVLVWRAFFFSHQTQNYQMTLLQSLREQPLPALLTLGRDILLSLWRVAVAAWGNLFRLPDVSELGTRSLLMLAGVILMAAGLTAGFFWVTRRGEDTAGNGAKKDALGGLVTGGLSLLAAGWPFWLIGIPPALEFAWDRFTLPFVFGASLVFASLLAMLPVREWVRLVLLVLLVSLSAGWHFQNATVYRRDWETQRRFFWQLAWRMPELASGTTLLVNELPLTYYSDNSLTAPLNWYWSSGDSSREMAYLLFYPERRLGTSLPLLLPWLPLEVDYLAANFHGSTSNVVALVYEPPACLRVLDNDVEVENKMLPYLMQKAAIISDPGWIDPSQSGGMVSLPEDLYGSEPEHCWCYYFQQADLRRQHGDWEQVAALGDLAFSTGDYPNDPMERLPFIEGYAHTGNWARAAELSAESAGITPMMTPVLCRLWQRIDQNSPSSPDKQAVIQEVVTSLGCTW